VITALLPDSEVPDVDAVLVGALGQKVQCGLNGKPALSFGVESESGKVYRVIRTASLWEAGRIFDLVTEMGFVIARGEDASRKGLTRVFR
jgi:hypothetical protein